MAHITGGGITDNLPRVLPPGLTARVDRRAWRTPPVFRWLGEAGSVPELDLRRSFNMGIGLILVVAPEDVSAVQTALLDAGEANAVVVGAVEPGEGGVRYA
jgi:phosphoribosylaminoimidazole (AIR) synthetase